MKPYKIAMAIIMMAVTVNTFGQSMTYNHDASKMGQIQVMELGAGVLSSIVLFPFALKQRHRRGQPSHLTALYRAFSLTYPDAVFTFLVPILRILCPIGQMQKSCSSL